MQLDVVDMKGNKVGQIEVADAVFGREVKDGLLWEVVKAQRAARRAGTHDTKTRADVRGGGKKPYKQKGTGNARQGSTRAPHFVGGGTVFGPHPRSYAYNVNKKIRRAALASALSLRAQEKKLFVVEGLKMDKPRTKDAAMFLKTLGVGSALVVDDSGNPNLALSLRNIQKSKCIASRGLNVYDVLDHAGLLISREAVSAVESRVVSQAKE